jgi:hypothetical protein
MAAVLLITAESARAASWTPLESYDPRGWKTNAAASVAWPASNHVSWASNGFLTVSNLFLLQTNIVGHIPNPTNPAALLTITNTVGYYCGTRMPATALPVENIRLDMEDWRLATNPATSNLVAEFFVNTNHSAALTTNSFLNAAPTNTAILDAPDSRVWDLWSAIAERQLAVGLTNAPVTWIEFFGRDRWEDNAQRLKSALVSPASLNSQLSVGPDESFYYHSTNISASLSAAYLDGRKYDQTAAGFADLAVSNGVMRPLYDVLIWGVDGLWTNNATTTGPFDLGNVPLFSTYQIPRNFGQWTPPRAWAEQLPRHTIETNWFYMAESNLYYSAVVTNYTPYPEVVDVFGLFDGSAYTNYTWTGISDGYASTDYGLDRLRPMLADMVTTKVAPASAEVRYVDQYGTGVTHEAAVSQCLANWAASPAVYEDAGGVGSYGYLSESWATGPAEYNARLQTWDAKVYYAPPTNMTGAVVTAIGFPLFGATGTIRSADVAVAAGTNLIWDYVNAPDASFFAPAGEIDRQFYSYYLHADWRPVLKYP